jgi:hypothetical protein
MQAWRTFLDDLKLSQDYQLDDLVLTGRVTVLHAAKGSTDVLSEHSNISPKWAGQYREHMQSPDQKSNIRAVISQINKQQKIRKA